MANQKTLNIFPNKKIFRNKLKVFVYISSILYRIIIITMVKESQQPKFTSQEAIDCVNTLIGSYSEVKLIKEKELVEIQKIKNENKRLLEEVDKLKTTNENLTKKLKKIEEIFTVLNSP